MTVQYAWLREERVDYSERLGEYTSYHRVGCIAAEKIGKNKFKIAFSLAAPSDKCDLKHAKRLAIRRLNFKTKTKIITRNDVENAWWDEILNLTSVVSKHARKGRLYADDRNQNALLGITSET